MGWQRNFALSVTKIKGAYFEFKYAAHFTAAKHTTMLRSIDAQNPLFLLMTLCTK